MSRHTSGPWRIGTRNWRQTFVFAGTQPICRLDIVDEVMGKMADDLAIETEANARLIAAAPQMLEALEAMLKRFQPEQHDAAGCMFKSCELCKAIAAIKAAKGEV